MEFSELLKEPYILTATATQDHEVKCFVGCTYLSDHFISFCSEHFVVLYPTKKQQNKMLYQLCQSSELIYHVYGVLWSNADDMTL